jgi:hypothetical protein
VLERGGRPSRRVFLFDDLPGGSPKKSEAAEIDAPARPAARSKAIRYIVLPECFVATICRNDPGRIVL